MYMFSLLATEPCPIPAILINAISSFIARRPRDNVTDSRSPPTACVYVWHRRRVGGQYAGHGGGHLCVTPHFSQLPLFTAVNMFLFCMQLRKVY